MKRTSKPKKSKSITFKTAFVIVLGLHVFGFFAITQISSYRANLARDKKRSELLTRAIQNPTMTSNQWPSHGANRTITTVAPKQRVVSNTIISNKKPPGKKENKISPAALASLILNNEEQVLRLIEKKRSLISQKQEQDKAKNYLTHKVQIKRSMPISLRSSLPKMASRLDKPLLKSGHHVIIY